MLRQIVLSIFILLNLQNANAFAQSIKSGNVEAELISENTSVEPGKTFWVGLRLKMDEGWHSYFENPGDSGMATKIKWDLPAGFSAGALQWPTPKKFLYTQMAGYGYEGEVLLLSEVTAPADLEPGTKTLLRVSARWLTCKDICMPGRGDFALELPVGIGPAMKDSQWEKLFEKTRSALPVKESVWQVKTFETRKNYKIVLTAPVDKQTALTRLEFFPKRSDLIEHFPEEKLTKTNLGYELLLVKSDTAPKTLERMEGVLVSDSGWLKDSAAQALAVNAPIEKRK